MLNEKVNTLVETRINGNSIINNKTYCNMLKSIKKQDILDYSFSLGYGQLYGTKLEMIEQLKNYCVHGQEYLG